MDFTSFLAASPLVNSTFAVVKLQELQYEERYCKVKDVPPINPLYFTGPVTTGPEQLQMFASICSWLLELCGSTEFPEPSEFDDPNSIASQLVQALQGAEIRGQIPVHKLRQGHGQTVCAVLHALTQRALVHQRFVFGDRSWESVAPEPREARETRGEPSWQDDFSDNLDMESGSSDGFELVESSPAVALSEGPAAGDTPRAGIPTTPEQRGVAQVPAGTFAPGVNSASRWEEEYQQAAEGLAALQTRPQERGWRGDITRLIAHSTRVTTATNRALPLLKRVLGDLSGAHAKIARREEFLNSQAAEAVAKLQAEAKEQKLLEEQLAAAAAEAETLSGQMQEVTNELQVAARELARQGERMSDTGPLERVKAVIAKMNTEIDELNLKICLAQQQLFSGLVAEATHE